MKKKINAEKINEKFDKITKMLNIQKAREFLPLYVGSNCLLQQQSCSNQRKLERRKVVFQVVPHDQIVISYYGLQRLTRKTGNSLSLD